MKVATKLIGSCPIELEVMKSDSDGDVYISTAFGGFYVSERDVPRFIRALQWAITPKAPKKKAKR